MNTRILILVASLSGEVMFNVGLRAVRGFYSHALLSIFLKRTT